MNKFTLAAASAALLLASVSFSMAQDRDRSPGATGLSPGHAMHDSMKRNRHERVAADSDDKMGRDRDHDQKMGRDRDDKMSRDRDHDSDHGMAKDRDDRMGGKDTK